MEIIHIANCGFLIKTTNRKILIDALFGRFDSDWCVMPAEDAIEKMKTGAAPFDNIDVILVSHAHIDHFNAEIVIRNLESNRSAVLVCPQQVRQELEKARVFEELSQRVIEITPEKGKSSQFFDITDVTIKIWGLKHSPYFIDDPVTGRKRNRHANVQNLGFTVCIDNHKVFHGGDWNNSGSRMKVNPLLEDQIDIAFLTIDAYLRLFARKKAAVEKFGKPQHIVVMHIPPNIDVNELSQSEKKLIATATVFTSPFEVKDFG